MGSARSISDSMGEPASHFPVNSDSDFHVVPWPSTWSGPHRYIKKVIEKSKKNFSKLVLIKFMNIFYEWKKFWSKKI
jgi:hypothetical protein